MMNAHADSYFHIGVAHYQTGVPCQDYALAKNTGVIALGVIADGCSSGGHTDVGARVLTLSTVAELERLLKEGIDEPTVVHECIDNVQDTAMRNAMVQFSLADSDMLATCNYVYVTQEKVIIRFVGDGSFVCTYRDGSRLLRRLSWNRNMPFYPAYRLLKEGGFVEAQGGQEAFGLSVEHISLDPNGVVIDQSIGEHTVADGVIGHYFEFGLQGGSDLEVVSLFSDGLELIDGYSWLSAAVALTSFKNHNGEFVKRRMIRGLKELSKEGRGPIDDIATVSIHLN